MQEAFKEARLKAMRLLTARDYTEQGLKDKLLRGGFPEEAVTDAIEYVKSFGYIDDLRYARNYMRCSNGVRSRREAERKLLARGVSAELVREAMDEEYPAGEGEDELIRELIRKRCKSIEEPDYKARQKLLAYMFNKGFSPDRVNRILDEVLLDITS